MASPVVRATLFYGLRNSYKYVSAAVNRLPSTLSSFHFIQKRYCEQSVSQDIQFYEPPYLVHLKPPLPVFDFVNFQLCGYDYTVLERFGKFLYKVCIEFGVDVNDGWVTPKQSLVVSTVKPFSNVIDSTYKLSIYERNLQISSVPVARVPILISVIQAALPPGVKFSFHHHELNHEEIRYVPNLELMELEQQLEEAKTKK